MTPDDSPLAGDMRGSNLHLDGPQLPSGYRTTPAEIDAIYARSGSYGRSRKTPHAIERAAERYGLLLTVADLQAISTAARAKGVLQAKQADGGSIWLVSYKGTVIRVVLSPRHNVVTFLPKNATLSKRRIGEK